MRLYFRQWNRQAQAVHSVLSFRVSLVLEGIPPHAWDREVAEDLLGSSCLVDMVAPETSARRDLSAFRLSAWTADPDAIPSLRWLAIPEPGLSAPLMEPSLLQYKILIHLDSVMDFAGRDEPLFLGVSSDSGQSGLPSDGRISESSGSAAAPRSRPWRFGVRDTRGSGSMPRARGGDVPSARPLAGGDWCLPPMPLSDGGTVLGPTLPVRDRLSVRVSAFDRLTTQEGPLIASRRNSNGGSPGIGGAAARHVPSPTRQGLVGHRISVWPARLSWMSQL